MRRVFVDTGGIIASKNIRDAGHLDALRMLKDIRASQPFQFVSTDSVLTEFCNSYSKVHLRVEALDYVDAFRASPVCMLVNIDALLFDEALTLYRSRPDKEWGLTDCTSFVVMRREKIVEAFTTDIHFEQAGFVRLIQSSR